MANVGALANNDLGVAANGILGFQITEHQSIGIGIGAESYDSIFAMPIFADIRTYLLAGGVKPFLFIEPGYSVVHRQSISGTLGGNVGGLGLKGGTGLKIFVGTNFAILCDVAFVYQEASRKFYIFSDYPPYYMVSEASTPIHWSTFEVAVSF